MKGSINGRIVDDLHADLVSPLDRGFLYSDGLYETMRVRNRSIEFIEEHVARLLHSTRELRFPFSWSGETVKRALIDVVQANGVEDLALRITVTRGVGGERISAEGCKHCTIVVSATPFAGYPDRLIHEGFRIAISPFPRNERSPLSRHKTTGCLDAVIARDTARQAGADDALFLNTAGRVAETTVANLFLVIGHELVTPPPDEGLLPGIVRAEILRIASGLGLSVQERPVDREELFAATELFLTNSLLGLAPIAEIDRGPTPRDAAGGLRLRLQEELNRAIVGRSGSPGGPGGKGPPGDHRGS